MADKTREQLLNEYPLGIFSIYTDIHSKVLISLGKRILETLEASVRTENGVRTAQRGWHGAYGDFWLWTLGAYEVVRTMVQAKECFSPRLQTSLVAIKSALASIRMPFAKQELRGQDHPIGGEPSVVSFGDQISDLQYKVDGKIVSARALIEEFRTAFEGITRADVLADHRTTYPSSPEITSTAPSASRRQSKGSDNLRGRES